MASPLSQSSATPPAGFWSYTHRDDELEGGRIRRLAEKLQGEYELLTGETLTLFVDKSDISWGEEWRTRIDGALTGTTFFIPIITPKYFQSQECRRELILFADQSTSLGVEELFLPILYADVPMVTERDVQIDDPAVKKVRETQYENWTHLRLAAEDSAEYRTAVNRLASRLASVAATVATRPTILPEEASVPEAQEDEQGLLEILAQMEEAMPKWGETINGFAPLFEQMGVVSTEATEKIEQSDARGAGFAGRLRVARELAAQLQPLADEMNRLATDYISQLVELDPGVLTMIRLANDPELGEEDRDTAREMFESIRGLAEAARQNVTIFRGLIDSLATAGNFNRELGRETRRIKDGLRLVLDGQSVIDEWERRIDSDTESQPAQAQRRSGGAS